VSESRLLVLATGNAGKARELEALLGGLQLRVTLLRDVAGPTEIPEPFATFRENARRKAEVAARIAGEWALGEDSGLSVEALQGRPGVYSARFAGAGQPDAERVALLLRMLEGVPEPHRTARFHCALCLAAPHGVLGEWEGLCEGTITSEPRGQGGFGYDPIFVPRGQARTSAELAPDGKNAISHRGLAMRRFVAEVPRLLETREQVR
jgi:XTP/dITP diphosphohydrolase